MYSSSLYYLMQKKKKGCVANCISAKRNSILANDKYLEKRGNEF